MIVKTNVDGIGEVNLTNNYPNDASSREDWAPQCSPDGTKSAFIATTDHPCCGDWDIYVMSADGAQTNLTNDPSGDDYPT